MGCDGFAVLKGLELCVAIACIILKRVSDDEAEHIFYQLEKLSKEWPLLNTITWEENGSSFADITFGGFVLITAGLLIGYVLGELRRAAKMEVFFLLLGTLMFGVMGALCLAAVESVPPNLVDNAIALGVLALIGALLFILDLLLRSKRPGKYKKPVHAITQTASSSASYSMTDVDSKVTQTNGYVKDTSTDSKNHSGVITELRSSMKGSKASGSEKSVSMSPDVKVHKGQNGGFVMDEESRIGTVYQPRREDNDALSFEKTQSAGSAEYMHGDRPTTPVSHDEYYKKRRPRRTEYSSGESDFDDFIHLPTVSFLLAEREEERRKKAERGSERKGTKMLPMMPVMRSDHEEFRKTKSIENLVRREDLERERRELENEREQLARERERYLFNNRKQMEMMEKRSYATSPDMKQMEKRSYATSPDMKQMEKRSYATSPDMNQMEKRSYATSPDAKQKEMMEKRSYSTSPDMTDSYLRARALSPAFNDQRKKSVTITAPEDEVREKLSQQGFVKVSSEPTKRKNVGFSKSYPGSPEEKHRNSQENEYQDVYTKPTKKDDGENTKSAGSQTPDFNRLREHWRYDSRDANSARRSVGERSKPASPLDPGFVLHTASNWPEVNPKTPSDPPSEKNVSDDEDRPVLDPPTGKAPGAPKSQRAGKASLFNVETSQDEKVEVLPGTLTTQLLQKWLKRRTTGSEGSLVQTPDQRRGWL